MLSLNHSLSEFACILTTGHIKYLYLSQQQQHSTLSQHAANKPTIRIVNHIRSQRTTATTR